jgi:hypothetical protein
LTFKPEASQDIPYGALPLCDSLGMHVGVGTTSMPRYENLYLISPAVFVSELEKEIEEMRRQQSQLDERVTTFQDLANEVLDIKTRQAANAKSVMKKWHYDVRFPNYMLDNLYAMEQTPTRIKRWVGPESSLQLLLLLDRSIQHSLEINIVDFFQKDIEENFKISVDSEDIPWLSVEKRSYQAIIPEDNRPGLRNHTQISIGCSGLAQPVMPEGERRKLWFSISSMTVRVLE